MKRSLALSTALALSLAGCATPPSAPNKATTAAAQPPVGCVAQTATRLPVKDDTCAGFGRTHTKEAIDSTGQTNLDRALQMLDPSISRH